MNSFPGSDKWEQALRAGTAALGLSLPEETRLRLRQHAALLQEHNRRAGLTAITDPVEMAIKHYLDSLSALLVYPLQPGETVVDLGSGGGFPGLVLAMVQPEAHVTLIDSSRKRTEFLRLAAPQLEVPHVTVVTARAEAVGQAPAHRECYDLVTARAVAALPVLFEYGLPLTRIGGHLLAMKGPEGETELTTSAHALEVLGGEVETIKKLSLPQNLGERTLLLIRKVKPTPARYPRRPGIPAKRPL